jgi:hypothetical protein
VDGGRKREETEGKESWREGERVRERGRGREREVKSGKLFFRSFWFLAWFGPQWPFGLGLLALLCEPQFPHL